MKVKQIAIMLIGVSLMEPSLRVWAEEVIHRTGKGDKRCLAEIVYCKSEKDVEALQAAKA